MAKEKQKQTDPITSKKDVEHSNDPKIDQDVPGFPHHPSTEKDMKEKNPTSKAHETKDAEKE